MATIFRLLLLAFGVCIGWEIRAQTMSNIDLELQKAEDVLLTSPLETLRIVENLQTQITAAQPREFVRVHMLGARAKSLLGDSDAILRWAEPARALGASLQEPRLYVQLLGVLAEGYEFAGDTARAEIELQNALKIAESAQDDWLVAYALNLLGWMHNRKLDEKRAMASIKRAYKLMQSLPQDDLYYDLLNNLGTLYGNKDVGKEEESLKLLREAQLYFAGKNKHFYTSVILYNLGWALKNVDSKASLEAFQEAYHRSELIGDESTIAYCQYGMSQTYSQVKDFKAAEDLLRKAAAGFIKTSNPMMHGEALKFLLESLVLSRQYEKAYKLLAETESNTRKIGNTSGLILVLAHKITILEALGYRDEELKTYREYATIYKKYQIEQDKASINKFTAEFDLERKEHEKNVLTNQNKLQGLELERADRTRKFLIGAVFLSLCVMFLAVRSTIKDREIKRQKERIQQILDSIQEGILRFGADFVLEKDYSQHLKTLLGRQDDLSGKKVLTVLIQPSQLSADDKSQVQEALHSMLGEPRLGWELNSGHLPDELIIEDRIINLQWEPLFDAKDRLETMQLILRDITESRRLEKKFAEERARSGIWQERLTQLLSRDFRRALAFLDQTWKRLDQDHFLERLEPRELLRELHTIKGNARTLGLRNLADVSHRLEAALISDDAGVKEAMKQAFEQEMQAWVPLMQSMVSASEQKPEHMHELIMSLVPGLQSMLSKAGLPWDELVIRDQVHGWSPEMLESMRTVLLHGLTNALDHGYIQPLQRGETVAACRLAVEATAPGDQLQVVIRDFGCGLDWNRIRSIAEAKGFQPAPGRPWSDVLLLDGTSTADEVSETSGRGVGLSAVASVCRELNGQVSLLDNDQGSGTKLVLQLPI
ncbi:MAG TPA: ATP-binding protein [Oligoflexus sp.]|uniref:ATP-binding protein n=1 Tax=Oligoflexus sp. TaxID=1971216 RepID=UPI002D3B9E2C|nr:ATP-binding protein [Oligoflexus sp.]HYX34528.1 ATP-binding protein [Oligoflexus sp.]